MTLGGSLPVKIEAGKESTAVESSSAKPRFYRPELDVLRFLAFLLVFWFHFPWIEDAMRHPWFDAVCRAGRYGVCIFFLLSAYLITELLIRERNKSGTIRVKAFFIRRALRIWPLYFLAIALAYGLSSVLRSAHLPGGAFPFLVLLSANLYVIWHGWVLNLINPLWSISVEEQFYLIVPSLVKRLGMKSLQRIAIAAIAVAYLALGWLAYRHASTINAVWPNSFVQFQFFAAGTLVAIGLHGKKWEIAPLWRMTLLLGGLLAYVIVETALDLHGPPASVRLIPGYLVVLIATVAIFLGVLNAPIRPPKVLTYLGKISYGLYVYHGFVVGLLDHHLQGKGLTAIESHIICLFVTIAIAAISYQFFEQRILRYKERFAVVKSGAEAVAA